MISSHDFFRQITVIELASVLAGPSVGRFFAEHGARVIKIENPLQGGDVTRSWRNRNEPETGISAYYASVNQGKEVIMLNLKEDSDRARFYEFLSEAHLLLSNFRFGEDVKLGVSIDRIRLKFPGLIIGQIDSFSGSSSRPAYDLVLQAESGYLSMSGSAEGGLAKMPVAFIDMLAGHQLKAGILMAFLHHQRCGEGSLVRVSLMDVAVSSLMNQATNYLMTGWVPSPMGTLHPNICPYGEYFSCKDDALLILAVGNTKQFEALLDVLQVSDDVDRNLFLTNHDRVQHRELLWELLKPYFRLCNRSEWLNKLEHAGVPAGGILSVGEVFDSGSYDWMVETQLNDGLWMKSVRVSALRFE